MILHAGALMTARHLSWCLEIGGRRVMTLILAVAVWCLGQAVTGLPSKNPEADISSIPPRGAGVGRSADGWTDGVIVSPLYGFKLPCVSQQNNGKPKESFWFNMTMLMMAIAMNLPHMFLVKRYEGENT